MGDEDIYNLDVLVQTKQLEAAVQLSHELEDTINRIKKEGSTNVKLAEATKGRLEELTKQLEVQNDLIESIKATVVAINSESIALDKLAAARSKAMGAAKAPAKYVPTSNSDYTGISEPQNYAKQVSPPALTDKAAVASRKASIKRTEALKKLAEQLNVELDVEEEVRDITEDVEAQVSKNRTLPKDTKDAGYYNRQSGKFIKTGGAVTTSIVPDKMDGLAPSTEYGKNRLGPVNARGVEIPEGIVSSKLPSLDQFGSTKEWLAAVQDTQVAWFKNLIGTTWSRGAIDLSKVTDEMANTPNVNKIAPRMPGTSSQVKAIVDEIVNDPTGSFYMKEIAKLSVDQPIKQLHAFRKLAAARGYDVAKLMPVSAISKRFDDIVPSDIRGTGPVQPLGSADTPPYQQPSSPDVVVDPTVGVKTPVRKFSKTKPPKLIDAPRAKEPVQGAQLRDMFDPMTSFWSGVQKNLQPMLNRMSTGSRAYNEPIQQDVKHMVPPRGSGINTSVGMDIDETLINFSIFAGKFAEQTKGFTEMSGDMYDEFAKTNLPSVYLEAMKPYLAGAKMFSSRADVGGMREKGFTQLAAAGIDTQDITYSSTTAEKAQQLTDRGIGTYIDDMPENARKLQVELAKLGNTFTRVISVADFLAEKQKKKSMLSNLGDYIDIPTQSESNVVQPPKSTPAKPFNWTKTLEKKLSAKRKGTALESAVYGGVDTTGLPKDMVGPAVPKPTRNVMSYFPAVQALQADRAKEAEKALRKDADARAMEQDVPYDDSYVIPSGTADRKTIKSDTDYMGITGTELGGDNPIVHKPFDMTSWMSNVFGTMPGSPEPAAPTTIQHTPGEGMQLGKLKLTDPTATKVLSDLSYTIKKGIDSLFVNHLDTEPEARNQGYGSQLLAKVEEIASDRGLQSVKLNALADKVPFYEKRGYINDGPVSDNKLEYSMSKPVSSDKGMDLSSSTMPGGKLKKESAASAAGRAMMKYVTSMGVQTPSDTLVQNIMSAGVAKKKPAMQANPNIAAAMVDNARKTMQKMVPQAPEEPPEVTSPLAPVAPIPMGAPPIIVPTPPQGTQQGGRTPGLTPVPVTKAGTPIAAMPQYPPGMVGKILGQATSNVQNIMGAAAQGQRQTPTTPQGSQPYMGQSNMPGAVGFRGMLNGSVFTDQAAYNQAMDFQKQAAIQAAVTAQVDKLQAMTGLSAIEAGVFRDELKQILPPTKRVGELIKVMGNAFDTSTTSLTNVATGWREQWLKRNPMMKGTYTEPAKASTWSQRVFGEKYKASLTFENPTDAIKTMEAFKQFPGMLKVATKDIERFGGLPDDVLHNVTVEGRLYGEDISKGQATIRSGVGGLAQQPSSRRDKSSLQFGGEHLSLQERLTQSIAKMRGIQKDLVRGQMSMLGMYFSMMSVTNTISKAWSTLAGQVSSLDSMFKGIAEGIAFGSKFSGGQKFLQGMLKDTNGLVTSWKNYTGLMGIFSGMLTYIAYKVFTNDRLLKTISLVIDKIAEIITDPSFVDSIVTLIETVVKALPGIISGLGTLVTTLKTLTSIPGFDKISTGMVQAGLAAMILMPILAALGGAVETLVLLFGGLKWMLVNIPAFLAAIGVGFQVLAGTIPMALGTLLAAITGGFLVGLTGVWLLLKSGIIDGLAEAGKQFALSWPITTDFLKVLLAPIGMLGALAIELAGTGVKVFWDTIDKLFKEGVGPALTTLVSGIEMLFKNILARFVSIVVDAMGGAVGMLAAGYAATFGKIIPKALLDIDNLKKGWDDFANNAKNNAAQWALNGQAEYNLANTGSIAGTTSKASGGTSVSNQQVTINNNIGSVTTQADLTQVLDAANKSAKYGYGG